jgi:hypothetical protein
LTPAELFVIVLTEDTNMAEEKKYKDAMETHGLKGTALPAAKGTGEFGTPLSKGDLGVSFDTQAPIPQNIIVADKDGERVVARIDGTALGVLRAKNKGKEFLTYEGAALIAKSGEYAEAVVRTQPAAEAPEVAQPKKGRRKAPIAAPTFSAPTHQEPESIPEVPKTKVRFTGAFGSLTYPYTSVHREGIYLVMVQYDKEGNFFEAPMSADLVEVHVGPDRLMCYPGPQFRLAQDGQIFVTVYLIDREATAEVARP